MKDLEVAEDKKPDVEPDVSAVAKSEVCGKYLLDERYSCTSSLKKD